jgi:hypothetical protein
LRRAFKRPVGSAGGLTLVLVGIPVFVTPIPLGLPMIALGLFLLLQTSARARLLRRLLARRHLETARRFDSARRQLMEAKRSSVDGLSVMFDNRCRHLPIVHEGTVVGMLSCRDIPTEHLLLYLNWVESVGPDRASGLSTARPRRSHRLARDCALGSRS